MNELLNRNNGQKQLWMFVTQGAEGGCFDELFEGAKEKRSPFSFTSSEQPSSRSSDTAATLIRACKSSEAQSMPTDNRRNQVPHGSPDQLERGVRLIDSPRGVIEDQDDSNISQNVTMSRIQASKSVRARHGSKARKWKDVDFIAIKTSSEDCQHQHPEIQFVNNRPSS
ncbi:hypothetical protein BU15DRAFT_66202 [Melanogaster broomeanus]|nr:hypothetical protein BU15DRAFT_66202 [Melanogaster broomeanus]